MWEPQQISRKKTLKEKKNFHGNENYTRKGGGEERELISHFFEWKKKNQTNQQYLLLKLIWIMSVSWPYYVPTVFAMNEVHTRSNQMKSFDLT